MSNQIAATIIQQLGGNRFIAMTGAKNFVTGGRDATFRVGKNAGKVTHVKIKLNAADLYDVTFYNIRGINMKTVDERENVYADRLEGVFAEVTGMSTRLQ